MKNQNQKKKLNHNLTKTYRDIGPYLGLGTQLAATIVLMFFVGRWLDGYFESEPWLTIIFSFLGGFAGIYNFIKTVLDLNKKQKIEKDS
ncbi:MAG: AtpZ/AtpI family protein [Bacteroidota bacterium]